MANTKLTLVANTEAFHPGEQLIQDKLGKRQTMADIGNRFIRDHMLEQHSDFYLKLSYVFIGHLDHQSAPWAAIFYQTQDLVKIIDNKTLLLNTQHQVGFYHHTFNEGDEIGLLGIELSNKRRNRLSGTIEKITKKNVRIKVKQSFGNCAKYITPKYRSDWQKQPNNLVKSSPVKIPIKQVAQFDQAMMQLIKKADSFFVASYYFNAQQALASNGVDVSYRGGEKGFVDVVSTNKLVIPDYSGNNFFNTLGNIEKTGKASLLFIDDKTGDILSTTGKAEILWHKAPTMKSKGAQRFWRFSLNQAYWHKQALPFTFSPSR